MNTITQLPLNAVIHRLHTAMNEHDLDAFVGCFAPDYASEQPVHPDRTFQGNDQVRRNWAKVFASIPDFHADLLRWAADGEMIWSEWHWYSQPPDQTPFAMRGVILFGVQNDHITWSRLYMESVQATGPGIDAATATLTKSPE
jgi:limonene-1,2-epoxide hydrolase